MDLNPIDNIEDAVSKSKKRLVKYVKGKVSRHHGPSIASGQSNRKPSYYNSGRKRPYRRP